MKKTEIFRMGLILVLAAAFCLLAGCGTKPCEHQWKEADCLNPACCSLCGETQGEALGHDWAEADCLTAACCTLCGETQGEALGHDWAEADCATPEHCTRCEETRGETTAHSYGRWLLDAESMYRVCAFCGQSESTEIDYALYLSERVYGHWNLCSMVKYGRYYDGQMLPNYEVDPEYCFYEDGRVVSLGFEEKELCTSWSIDRSEYDSANYQHRIYITSPESNALGNFCFTCFGDNLNLTVPLNDKGDTATLSNSFGDIVAELAAGTWSTWAADGLHSITLAEDRSFTADIDGEISGFWQPRQPMNELGYNSHTIYIMLNYEKDGKQYSQYASMDGIDTENPSWKNRDSLSMATYINDTYMHFGLDAEAFLTEASGVADTAHLGTWTSIDYIVSTMNYETYSSDEERGLSTEYSITFLEDGTFTANLHKETNGRWELREIRRDYSGTVYVYRLLASGIEDYSYFQMYHESETMHDAYLYISNNDNSSANYTLRQMSEAEVAAQNEFAEKAPKAVVGEWFSVDGLPYTAVFNEDGTFTLRSESAENPSETHGYWHFNAVSEYDGAYTYIYDMETIIENEDAAAAEDSTGSELISGTEAVLDAVGAEPAEAAEDAEEQTYWEDYAIVLHVGNGIASLEIDSFYAWGWGELTNAEGLTVLAEALADIVGHWRADTAMEYDANLENGEEVPADFRLDIAEDGSFTGYVGQNIQGRIAFYRKEDGETDYLVEYSEGPSTDALYTLADGSLYAFVSPYRVEFQR